MTQSVPDDTRRVEGCTCGGRKRHRLDCELNNMPAIKAFAAIRAADERVRRYVSGVLI